MRPATPNPKLAARDAARDKCESVIALIHHGLSMFPTNNEKRAFLQRIKREAAKLYAAHSDGTQRDKPIGCEPIPGVRDNAFVLTAKRGEVFVTHSLTWIRIKGFEDRDHAIAWAVKYWTGLRSEQRQMWTRLTNDDVLRLVAGSIDPSFFQEDKK